MFYAKDFAFNSRSFLLHTQTIHHRSVVGFMIVVHVGV